MNQNKFTVEEHEVNMRLDKFLVSRLPDLTRHYLQKIIKDGSVFINGKKAKSSFALRITDKIIVNFPDVKELKLKPIDLDLDVVFENDDAIVINKKAGMVVHPGAGDSHSEDSLVNAILYHCKGGLSGIGGVMRPGIVHRLDKDTSGLLVVAKNDKAHQFLSDQFKNRTVEKVYYALLVGHLEPSVGSIDAPIGRAPGDRKRMAVTNVLNGKLALTKYNVIKYLDGYTLVEVKLVTGRTHQIRVHFSEIGFPLVGDIIYGKQKINKNFLDDFGLGRVFLHAGKLKFTLLNGKEGSFSAELPEDLKAVLAGLETL